MWEDLKAEIRAKFRRLVLIWAISACVIFAAFVVFWYIRGVPSGPAGVGRTFVEILVISVVAPPLIWIIGKTGAT